jgi:hypothetical protein
MCERRDRRNETHESTLTSLNARQRPHSSRPAASVRYPETAIRFAKQGREMPFATSSNERTY